MKNQIESIICSNNTLLSNNLLVSSYGTTQFIKLKTQLLKILFRKAREKFGTLSNRYD